MDFHRQEAKLDSSEDYEETDDVFFDELRKQVMQLTAEDEDDDDAGMLDARKQGPQQGVPNPICYPGWPGIEEDHTATPPWMVNSWRSGNGTGVFIPQGVQSRRRNRPRKKNGKGRTKRQSVKTN